MKVSLLWRPVTNARLVHVFCLTYLHRHLMIPLRPYFCAVVLLFPFDAEVAAWAGLN